MFGLKTKEEKQIAIKDFLDKHLSDKLIIIADPSDDSLYMKYGKVWVMNKIKSMDGKKTNVVKTVLKHSRFANTIDKFIVSLMEGMKLSIKDGNQFFQWIDGALYAISNKLRINKKSNAQEESK